MKIKIRVKTKRSSDPDYNPFACATDILLEATKLIQMANVEAGGKFKEKLKAPLHDCDGNEVGELSFSPGIDEPEEPVKESRAARRLLS
jgi:hypothetical protein